MFLANSFKPILVICLPLIFISFSVDAVAAKKQALVIGNSDYDSKPLDNPVNDANDMSSLLKSMGFAVTKLINANASEMRHAIDQFGQRIADAEVTMVFFAGHGVQVDGNNYLIPVGANIKAEHQIKDRAVSLNNILGYLNQAKRAAHIVVLDACRDNPFASSFRSTSKGLARVDIPEGNAQSDNSTGTYISFATAEGKLASDGVGRNGLFTSKLLQHLPTDYLSFNQVITRVRRDVMRDSNNMQVPWSSSSLTQDLFLSGRRTPPDSASDPYVQPVKNLFPVTIRSNVFNDKVYINDEYYGSTRLDINLPPGSHLVRIEKEGYVHYESTLAVKEEGNNVLFATLEAEETLLNDLKMATEGLPEQAIDALKSSSETVGGWLATLIKWLGIVFGSLILLLVYLIASGRMKKILGWINE